MPWPRGGPTSRSGRGAGGTGGVDVDPPSSARRAHDHPHGRRLARPVRPEEAVLARATSKRAGPLPACRRSLLRPRTSIIVLHSGARSAQRKARARALIRSSLQARARTGRGCFRARSGASRSTKGDFRPTCSLCIPVPSTHAIRTDVDGRPRVVALLLAAVFNWTVPDVLALGIHPNLARQLPRHSVMVIVFFARS